jgi:hypothetical protein
VEELPLPDPAAAMSTERHDRAVPLRPGGCDTVSRVHLSAMRKHDRKAALLQWLDGRWRDTPDWRLDRQVIRLGLYLRERVGLTPGQRVAILSPPRREWFLADWSAAVQGATAVAIDPGLPQLALAAALEQIAPRAAFVSGPAALERLETVRSSVPGLEKIIAFDGPLSPERGALLSEVLDLGGTLDTPERAGAFRAQAREVGPDACALGYVEPGTGGSMAFQLLSHRDVIERLKLFWSREPARRGDVAYVAGSAVTLGLRLALLGFVGDGYTTTALGTPGREVEEITALGPHKILAPPAVLDAALIRAAVRPPREPGLRGWLEQVASLTPFVGRRLRRQEARAALGGRARWLRSTIALDQEVYERLRDVVAIDLEAIDLEARGDTKRGTT